MIKVLFDECHGELSCSQLQEDNTPKEAWTILCGQVKQLFGDDAIFFQKESLTHQVLEDFQLLILAAPKSALSAEEVKTIVNFVKQGNSLLIASDRESLVINKDDSINAVLETLGMRFEELLNHPPEKVFNLLPHYISSEVSQLNIKEPVYVKTLPNSPYPIDIIATLPYTGKTLIATVEVPGNNQSGRVVVLGNYLILSNQYINTGNNQKLASNILCWLAHQNSLDCRVSRIPTEVNYRQSAKFSIVIANPKSQRLENITCVLESDKNALIQEPYKTVRFLPGYGQTQVQWNVIPQQIGQQTLRLTIDIPELENSETSKISSLFFAPVAQFQCLPDAEFDLVFLNPQGKAQEIVETGVTFEVQVIARWKNHAKAVPLRMQLECPLTHIKVEQISTERWYLTVLDPGDWLITLHINDINQKITRLVHAYPSQKNQIEKIQRDVVTPLAAEINYQVSQIRQEFDNEVIRQIPFQLFTPEEQVNRLYNYSTQEQLLEALQAARSETKRFSPLVEKLLQSIAPTYSPIHGCCIPYDPKLAAHLIKEHPFFEEQLAYNFQGIEGYEHYGQTWLEGNIAALFLHEKYGHGFFYNHTKVGQQLAILYRHGLLRKVDHEGLKSPYLQLFLQDEYKSAIETLHHSSIILNEGFATWMELTILRRLKGSVSQTVYRRKNFLFNDEYLTLLQQNSEYFKHFEPFYPSRYQEGYEYLEEIQSIFGTECGSKCVVQAVIKAAEVDFGIIEHGGRVEFLLSPGKIEEDLLSEHNDNNVTSPTERLKSIWKLLRKHVNEIRAEQQRLQCHRHCLHPECPVNLVIKRYLEW
ncbi:MULTISPECIES: DUF4350 domain-containing protein [Nostoc]|uniref:Uncharacterized protein n=1 Tax=Nostoc paludosum FACHB-159 TaxID=2692908 RepID=A0ABR8KIZ8_9NOSO|nr:MULTISPECIES: DUF4350 domain-containing protein [Nostoc]MBD2681566.1 hypothetical protein [Nostoc sp. FACHB-857]MBD2738027.1 hypothetical protein [Nostoc paludosum FACHB-159]